MFTVSNNIWSYSLWFPVIDHRDRPAYIRWSKCLFRVFSLCVCVWVCVCVFFLYRTLVATSLPTFQRGVNSGDEEEAEDVELQALRRAEGSRPGL